MEILIGFILILCVLRQFYILKRLESRLQNPPATKETATVPKLPHTDVKASEDSDLGKLVLKIQKERPDDNIYCPINTYSQVLHYAVGFDESYFRGVMTGMPMDDLLILGQNRSCVNSIAMNLESQQHILN